MIFSRVLYFNTRSHLIVLSHLEINFLPVVIVTYTRGPSSTDTLTTTNQTNIDACVQYKCAISSKAGVINW